MIIVSENCFHHRNELPLVAPIQGALIRYGKQSFGIYWEVFRDLAIKEDFVTPYKPSEADKLAVRDDKFIEKGLFNLIDSSKKIVDDFKNLKPKMTAFVLQSITLPERRRLRKGTVQNGRKR